MTKGRANFFVLVRFYNGTWACGYGLYDLIPVPALPDGFEIFLFTYPMGNFLSRTLTLIGFLPVGYVGNGYPLPFLVAPGE